MSKFNVNYSSLENKITKRAHRLADVKDQLVTIAFDVVRFKDDDNEANLWQVQSSDDGDYIVAMYNEDSEDIEKKASDWSVLVSKNGSDLQVSYKGDPLVRLASSKLGIPNVELHQAEKYLPEKLASNKKLVKALLGELSEAAKLEVSRRYPELV